MFKIEKVNSRYVLDSRGFPTVQVQFVVSKNNVEYYGLSSVPSGASTGTYEALELRDGGEAFKGKHVSKAIENVNKKIAPKLEGKEFKSVLEIEKLILSLDKTENKSELGANAILGVSMAAHKAIAKSDNLNLFEFLNKTYFANYPMKNMPRLMCNVVNGGVHADSGLAIQEFMVVPKTGDIEKDVQAASEIYHTLKSKLKKDGHSVSLGDEGGFAPRIAKSTDVMNYLMDSMKSAGYSSNCDLAMDCAASEFYSDKIYTVDEKPMTSSQLNDFYEDLVKEYPLISIEDGFQEDDFAGWKEMTDRLGKKIHLIGDDLFVTNPKRFAEVGLEKGLANGVLIKLNQIGSVSETCQIINDAKENGYITIVSHRSGETTDAFMSDLAVASQSEFIKLGAPARGERVAKFNRLLEISDLM
ncbi:MAG: phosphopyruvate hydratase [Patescibacteria group bacterium]